ncbi:LCP family protein [Nocardia sp. NPDC056100]|uniref:LCP family protein n=1 Tax=Nocardia sp. NPDC056100 TaxID=3345712 RepID=UPI0035D5871D
MNGDDPQQHARMRREPPPNRASQPPAGPARPGANQPQPPRAQPGGPPRAGQPPQRNQGPAARDPGARPNPNPRQGDPAAGAHGPTHKISRDEPRPALAWSEVPPTMNRPPQRNQPPQRNPGAAPGNQPPRREPGAAQRNQPAPREQAAGQRNQPPGAGQRGASQYERTRVAAPMGHAPTQTPQPFREDSPPPPPPALPPKRGGGKGGGGDRPPRGPKPKRKRHWFRWITALLLIVLLTPIVAGIYVDTHLTRIDALPGYSGRIGDTPGTNWLLVGSDSRTGLTAEQEQELATGGEVGSERTDTIILVHLPKSGQPTLVSLPRDSYVAIPGHGKDKLNASFAFGGAPLLTQTVELATGLRIDHYAQIGFGGFADIVDAVGGIDMCLDQAINDPLAGIDLQAGCQHLNGAEALGFVRSRATARADLDRMLNQRKFLSALLKKATSVGTLANPFRSWPLIQGLTKTLKVDEGSHVWNLALLGKAMAGNPIATTVPVGGFEDVDGSGNVLLWDKTRAGQFFDALAADKPIPSDLITTVGN